MYNSQSINDYFQGFFFYQTYIMFWERNEMHPTHMLLIDNY